MKLHNYFRSSTSYRVRIALALKGLPYEYVSYHLREGEQRGESYLSINPQGLVPTLELDGEGVETGALLPQSMAILEYLDEAYPEPPLLPQGPLERARVRSLAYAVACDIHPLNNLRVLNYLVGPLGQDRKVQGEWFRHWVAVEFAALEQRLADEPQTGRFCHGDSPGLADLCLVPQVVNGRRFDCDMTPYPTIRRIHEACMEISAFVEAAPDRQPDTEN
ncbi:maleylacetoacetate isomerase [Pelagibius litoralis]|uniref:Maleylacetoacetate isomerase n=1 Tax=Pelagibius litoralis TaxID=374515 RepID=A0A967EZ44_9PROT|nr:maleylacetoacetate isomerase [Pelagibius litoralis]NIA70090.1 maleylacetoacetate isomerase [Pelagibius litoralis]